MKTGLDLNEFSNESHGSTVEWRIVRDVHRHNEKKPSLFVYRRRDRGDGLIISEYLHKDGRVDMAMPFDGHFRDYSVIGTALIKHGEMLEKKGPDGAYDHNYALYLKRFTSAV